MLRIVVVEDEVLLKKGIILTTDWEKFNCEVVGEASNGYEGIEVVCRLKPDIVITDVRMPGLDGVQMIEQLKGKCDAEYIIISGYSEFEYARQALRLGVKDYLMKPVDDQEFEQAIKNACETTLSKKQINKLQTKLDDVEESKIMLFKEHLSDSTKTTKSTYVEDCIKYISQYYSKNITIKDVADKLAISESHLSKVFKNEVGQTFVDYLTYYRIKRAMGYLKEPNSKIYEVADKIGYKDQRYFSMIFKKLVGVTPTEFKEQLNN